MHPVHFGGLPNFAHDAVVHRRPRQRIEAKNFGKSLPKFRLRVVHYFIQKEIGDVTEQRVLCAFKGQKFLQ